MKKATAFVASLYKISPDQAGEMIKSSILAGPYFKNKFNK